jgi:hypothetical protein
MREFWRDVAKSVVTGVIVGAIFFGSRAIYDEVKSRSLEPRVRQ